jgi:hypothetical protein
MRGMTAVIDEQGVSDKNTKIVILVKTAVTHVGHRMVIRETWAK